MRVRVFDIYQVRVELHPVREGIHQVIIAEQEICLVAFIRDAQRHFWRCPCNRCDVGKAEALLTHIITNHASVTYREPWRTAKADTAQDARSLEERLTYLRMVGLHADPTAAQAIRLSMEPV
jgi:hypothetical protein